MKRFYCTICKRIKRVRNLPSLHHTISNLPFGYGQRYVDTPPADRTGKCNRHFKVGK